MSVEKVYRLRCDGCGVTVEPARGVAFAEVMDQARHGGWTEVRTRKANLDYCASCSKLHAESSGEQMSLA